MKHIEKQLNPDEIIECLIEKVSNELEPVRRNTLPDDEVRCIVTGIVRGVYDISAMVQYDPLAEVDKKLSTEEIVEHISGEIQRARDQEKVLKNTYSAVEAASFIRKTPEWIEDARKQGHIMCLGGSSGFRYPKWQFDPTRPDGVVPGIAEVCERLNTSPFGVERWLTNPLPQLDGRRPIDVLMDSGTDEVLKIAKEHGYGP